MPPTELPNPWTIDLTSNNDGYPRGAEVEIIPVTGKVNIYTMKWRIADGREAMLTPLELKDKGTLLSNDTADGFIEKTKQGVYDVDIMVQKCLQRLSGTSTLVNTYATPGQLVGQWGAESTGTGEEESKPQKDQGAKPAKQPSDQP